MLENIRSASNVGSVFRTGDAFLIENIWLTGYTARPPHKEIFKTALGATESLTWHYEKDPVSCIRSLKEKGWVICAVEQAEGAVLLDEMEWQPGEKYAVVFGNEVEGISEAVMELADIAVEVPQWGTKHSLNISVCAGVVLWDFVRGEQAT